MVRKFSHSFFSTPSTHVWDEMGDPQIIPGGRRRTGGCRDFTIVGGRAFVRARPSLAKSKFDQTKCGTWPSLARPVRDNQYSPCFCEGVAGRRLATPSHKHGLCPPFVSTGLHVEHRRPKAGDAPHEGLLKWKGGGLGVLGFRV